MGTPSPYGAVLCATLLLAGPARGQKAWTHVPAPAVCGGTDILYEVDGDAWNDVWAVGYQSPRSGGNSKIYTLTLHYDGKSWQHVPSPNTDPDTQSPYNHLLGVKPTGGGKALAVGIANSASGEGQTLAMEWSGSSWSVVNSPFVPGGSSFLSLDRSPAGTVWASGKQVSTDPKVFTEGMLARWNGSGFAVEPAPAVGRFRNDFWGVSALSDNEIYCVGTWGDSYGDFRILLQRYDGNSRWTTFNVPTPGWMDSLQDVAALDSANVYAVGYFWDPGVGTTQPLILHFDGSAWTQEPLPPFTNGFAELRAVTAVAADDVYAGGTYPDPQGWPRPFLLHFDGSTWSEVTLPPSGGSLEWFRGMGVLPGGDTWLVGQYYDGTQTAGVTYRANRFQLDASPAVVQAGDTLTLASGPGRSGDPALLFVTAVDGVPSTHYLTSGALGADGWWSLPASVPPGLAGHTIDFLSFALDTGRVFSSLPTTVRFQ